MGAINVADMFSEARRAIIVHHPFWAPAAMQFGLEIWSIEKCMSNKPFPIKIAATDGSKMVLNPDGWASLSFEQRVTTFAHEMFHCLLGHILRLQDRDAMIWNVATDLVINPILVDCKFAPVDGWLFDEQFRGMDAETVYQHLVHVMEMENKLPKDLPGMYGSVETPDPMLEPGKTDRDDNDSYVADAETLDAMRTTWSNALSACKKASALSMYGNLPGYLEELFEREMRPRIPWRKRLRKFLTSRSRCGLNWARPSRRYVWMNQYMPSRGRPSLGKILVAVDTSGSVNNVLLSKFLAELDGIKSSHSCSMMLVTCDVEAKIVGEYKEHESIPTSIAISGRGGTSFVRPFEIAREKRVDLVVYLTDGMGVYPSRPKIATMWVLSDIVTESCAWYPPFGEVAFMPDE